MDPIKIKEMQCNEGNHLTPSALQSVTVDTMGDFAGPHGIGKRKFMITDILNNSNKNPSSVRSASPKSHRELLYPNTFGGGSAFQNICSSVKTLNTTGNNSMSAPTHLDISSPHPAAAAAAMAAMGAVGTDLRLYSNFLPAAALQQIQQHREQLLLTHQRDNSENGELDDSHHATHSNDLDVDEDNQDDSDGKKSCLIQNKILLECKHSNWYYRILPNKRTVRLQH